MGIGYAVLTLFATLVDMAVLPDGFRNYKMQPEKNNPLNFNAQIWGKVTILCPRLGAE